MNALILFLALLVFLPSHAVAGDTQLYTVLESGLYANPRYYFVNPRLGITWELGNSSGPTIVLPSYGSSNTVIMLPSPSPSRSLAPLMDFDAWDAEIEAMNADLDRDDLMMRQLLLMMPAW